MKKVLFICLMLIVSSIASYATEVKFIQVDSVKYSPVSNQSVSYFDNLVKDINKQKGVNFVIFSGDNIAYSDKQALKAFLKHANKLHAPYYIALGHKDLNKKKGLSKEAYMKLVHRHSILRSESPNYVFSKKGVTFIVADGAKEFIATPFGYYRENVIDWVDKELTKYKKQKVVIIQHFPVYPPADQEAYYTYKADEYMKVLSQHDNVIAVVSGFKINSEKDVNGVKHIATAEFPKYRIIEIMDCETDNPTIWSTLK